MAQPGKLLADGLRRLQGVQQEPAAVAIGDVSRVDHGLEDEPLGVDEQVPLAALYLLAAVVADGRWLSGRPPLSVVLTD